MFVHLHGHSTYSLLEWIGTIKNIVDKVKSMGMTHLALTDYSWVYWAIDFYQYAKSQEITPIIWVEIWYIPSFSSLATDINRGNIVLLAKSFEWYSHLLQVINSWYLNMIDEKPYIDNEILSNHSAWLYWYMWWITSYLWQAINNWYKEDWLISFLKNLSSTFQENSFLLEVIAQSYKKETSLKKINDEIVSLSSSLGLDTIISTNYHYINKEDKAAYELALAIKDWLKLYDDERRKIAWEYYLFSEDDVIATLLENGFSKEYIAQWITKTYEIAKNCNLELDLYQSLFPKYESPSDITQLYKANESDLIVED